MVDNVFTDQSDSPAILNVASILKSYCGRTGQLADGGYQDCGHDHIADAKALVEIVAEDAVPRFLRERLLDKTIGDNIAVNRVERMAAELEHQAAQRAAAYPPPR